MNLKGKQTFQAPAQTLWNILMDTDKLAKITPGISKLEKINSDQYNAISEVKIGPVKGSFKGDVTLADKSEPNAFTLHVKQKSKIGNADATVIINIADIADGQSELSFDGKAKLSGTLARTGQRVMSGVANTLTKQFFKGLEEELVDNNLAQPAKENEFSDTSTPSSSTAVHKETLNEHIDESVGNGMLSGFINWVKNLFRLNI